MVIILDNGHGSETSGKRSPKLADGKQLFEYEFNRDIVKRIARKLNAVGIPYFVLVPEINDVSLCERRRRANEYVNKHGECLLISIHANAGGGTGFEAYTYHGNSKADKFAEMLYEEAEKTLKGFKVRKDLSDGDADKESNFYILKHTKCPAVLSENLFMDTERDCRFLLSDEGREAIATLHFNAIKRYYDEERTRNARLH